MSCALPILLILLISAVPVEPGAAGSRQTWSVPQLAQLPLFRRPTTPRPYGNPACGQPCKPFHRISHCRNPCFCYQMISNPMLGMCIDPNWHPIPPGYAPLEYKPVPPPRPQSMRGQRN
uniref:Putative secreted protein n=1 Tax=Amblyomma triste TaxID=251400 RepID=A0A023G4D3_AMBTT